jgi:hypothetical protein
MENKQCACCGQETLPPASIFQICSVCGWHDDELQNDAPDYAGGANNISLNVARIAWKEGKGLSQLNKEAHKRFLEAEKNKPETALFECPCCDEKTVLKQGNFEKCEMCGWKDDAFQSQNPDFAGGANSMSLNDAIEAWIHGKPVR